MRQELEEELKKIYEMEVDSLKEETLIRKKQIEEELHKMYDYFADGAILRSRCTWYEKGEKSNKYFLSLEKSLAKNTCIDMLDTKDGLIRKQANIPMFIKESFQTFFFRIKRIVWNIFVKVDLSS